MGAHAKTLRRSLGAAAVLFYCFGDILGAGIYALIGEVAATAGAATPWAFALALSVAGLTGLSYAELGTRHPRSGVEVAFTARALRSEEVSLLVGLLVLASAIVSSAAVAHAFADYGQALVSGVPRGVLIAVFLLTAALLNYSGIENSSRANIVCTVVELSGLLLVIGAGAWFLFGNSGSPGAAATSSVPGASAVPGSLPTDPDSVRSVLRGGALAFFAFIGFEDVVNIAEEVRRPERTFPRAIIGAVLLAGVVYMAVAVVAVSVLDPATLASSEAPLLSVLERALPAFPIWIFGGIAMFAVANTGLLNSITASRLLYGTARQGRLPGWLQAVHSERQTPYCAIVLVLALSAVLAYSGSLVFLAGTTAVLLLVVFTTIHLGLLATKFRERGETAEGVFRTPPAVQVTGIVTSLGLLFWVPGGSLVRAAILIGCALLLVVLARRWRGDRDKGGVAGS